MESRRQDAKEPQSLPSSVGQEGSVQRRRKRSWYKTALGIHNWSDHITGVVLCSMVIFSPWAFGTTQEWSISIMNSGGYVLGGLLGLKWLMRWGWHLHLPRWRHEIQVGSGGTRRSVWINRGLAGFTALLLVYCLASAVNARAKFFPENYSFEYYECVAWLPQSYDSSLSWRFFWRCLALACSFWAARDWLLGKSLKEAAALEREGTQSLQRGCFLPSRLRLLLWVICLNGGLLAVEGIIQQSVGDGRLLWLVTPRINKAPESQFGPYAYRSNAAQYFLLAWPLAVGFWWVLRRRAHSLSGPARGFQNLLPCIFLMALVPLVSLSRAGALIGAATIAATLYLLAKAEIRQSGRRLHPIMLLLGLCAVFAFAIAGQQLVKRFREGTIDSNRHLIWQNSWKIVKEYPLFGTGPGTFDSVYQLYRPKADDPWYATAHNDWLETLLTFGAVGSSFALGWLLLLLARWVATDGIPIHRLFVQFVFLSLITCLVYAAGDFPLQIYSIQFLFLIVGSILASVHAIRR